MKKKMFPLLTAAAVSMNLLVGGLTGLTAAAVYADEYDDEYLDEINIALMCMSPYDQSVTDPIKDAVNAITEPELGLHCNISWYDAASYGTQVPMQIQAGEPLDLIMYTPIPGASFASYRAANQLLDIKPYLEEEGSYLLELEEDWIRGTQVGDAIYGIPFHYCLAGWEGIIVRKDLADEAGAAEDVLNASTWTELHDALKKISDYAGMAAVVNGNSEGTTINVKPYVPIGENLDDIRWFDQVGDGYGLIMVDEDTDTVKCYYDREEFKEEIARTEEWYNDGLIYKDAATAKDYSDTLIKAGVGFARISAIQVGGGAATEASTGYPILLRSFTPSRLGTSSVTKFGYCIPVTAQDPAAAVRYVNFLYQNEELSNTLAWGIEGQGWERTEDGLATYPEGVTADNAGYHEADYMYSNQELVLPWAGSDPDLRAQQKAALAETSISKYMGFNIDNTGLENILAACKSIKDQYHPGLDAGSTGDWEGTYETMMSKLKAAGIDDLIAAYQEQLDAWLAENN